MKILAKNEIKTKINSTRERKLKWSTIAAQFRDSRYRYVTCNIDIIDIIWSPRCGTLIRELS